MNITTNVSEIPASVSVGYTILGTIAIVGNLIIAVNKKITNLRIDHHLMQALACSEALSGVDSIIKTFTFATGGFNQRARAAFNMLCFFSLTASSMYTLELSIFRLIAFSKPVEVRDHENSKKLTAAILVVPVIYGAAVIAFILAHTGEKTVRFCYVIESIPNKIMRINDRLDAVNCSDDNCGKCGFLEVFPTSWGNQ